MELIVIVLLCALVGAIVPTIIHGTAGLVVTLVFALAIGWFGPDVYRFLTNKRDQ